MVRALASGIVAALLVASAKAAPPVRAPASAPLSSVRVEPAVKRGDSVAIVVRSGALEIRADGRALSSGNPGDRVRLFNESTRRTIEGTVEAPGIVVIVAR